MVSQKKGIFTTIWVNGKKMQYQQKKSSVGFFLYAMMEDWSIDA
jgi:hypothetical protein